jgi:hypothetical protein
MDYDLSQNLLGGGIPSSIPVRSFSRQDAREPAGLLEAFDGCPVLGVAVRLSAKGHVNLLALASPDRIYLLTTGSTDAEKFPANASLGELLGGSCTTVAGFEMAKLAIHIYNDLQCDVRGVDLSTLFSPCPRKAWEPSDFAAKRMSSDINSHNIYNVWDDSNEKRSGDHACLRAWFSARSCPSLDFQDVLLTFFNRAAQSCIFQLQAALKVDTHLLNPAVRITCNASFLLISP